MPVTAGGITIVPLAATDRLFFCPIRKVRGYKDNHNFIYINNETYRINDF